MSVLAWRLSKVFGAVSTEIRECGEIHAIGYLSERETFVIQIVFQYRYRVTVDVGGDAVPRHAAHSLRKVLWRNVESLGIVAHLALFLADASGEERHELLDDICCAVGVCACCISLCMCIEYVVHHCETEASHQFAVELMVQFVHSVTQAVEVVEQVLCLFVGETDDRILIQ